MDFIKRIITKTRERGLKYILYRGYVGVSRIALSPLIRHILHVEHRLQALDARAPNERPIEYAFALDALSLCRYQDILDVGPGQSPWPALLSACGYHVTAIDEMIRYWGRSITNRHFYVHRDDINSPRINKSFGIVTCLSTLEHVPTPAQAICAMANLLRAQGILILSFPYNEKRYIPNAYKLPEAGYGQEASYVCQIYDRGTLQQWVKETGLQLIQQRYYRVFTGEYWTCGARLHPPQEVTVDQLHHLTGIVLRKVL